MPMIHVNWPSEALLEAYNDGEYSTNATEPWTQQLLTSLVQAYAAETVLEIGSHTGLTSAWLALALQARGGGRLICVDVNEGYCEQTEARLAMMELPDVEIEVISATAIEAIEQLERHSVDLAYVDFLSDGPQISAALEKLWSWWDPEGLQRMSLGGLIAVHDVTQPEVAQAVVGHHGYVLLPQTYHLHGGLGLVQVPTQ